MRQAVVVIHGIGQQQPTDTLRGFVTSVLSEIERRDARAAGEQLPAKHAVPKFFSKPDRLSELFELRQVTAPSTTRRPVTHFYEYYWAHEIRNTKYGHLVRWLLGLLFTKPVDLTPKVRSLWVFVWAILLASPVFVWLLPPDIERLGVGAAELGILTAVGALVLAYLGDAARYLRPYAENVDTRRRIRAHGIELVRKLHESPMNYERIVLVGHSLGSVIGYDILQHYWVECHKKHGNPSKLTQRKLKELNNHVKAKDGDAWAASPDRWRESYRKLQRELWKEQRSLGAPWLVTDFITLGSPLTHAQFLVSRGADDLQQRVDQRELATCPPVLDGQEIFMKPASNYQIGGSIRSIRLLHHAAPFACTRWTNLYFPGDLVGGELSKFGRGVLNLSVSVPPRPWLAYLPFCHTWYWRKRGKLTETSKEAEATRVLADAMALNASDWLRSQPTTPNDSTS